ncbi:PAS domain-containing sensor histidine kinase [Candidatus Latescibacterota bacterium]
MKIARVGTGYIILIWILIVIMLGTVLYIGYRRNSTDLMQLMINEAERLIEVVGVTAQAGIHALDEVEYLTAQRLLENARLIERIAAFSIPSADSLTSIAQENDLYMINILDKNGNSLSRSAAQNHTGKKYGTVHRPEVESVLSGEFDEEVIGFMDGRYYSGQRYGVVVRRHGGGAVVVNTDSDKMLEFRKTIGLGTLFREIGSLERINYIVLQDTLGIVAASSGVREMTRIKDEPFLVNAAKGEYGSRIIRIDGENIFEVAYSLIVDDVDLGLLRIGLSTAEIDNIKHRAVRQFVIIFIFAMVSGAFVLIYVILRQNYMILNVEHDRILREVRRMEEDTRRSERLTSMGRLAAGMAHEIRNPLNSINIIVQRLKAEFTTVKDREVYKDYLSTVKKEISRISYIIEQFLKYARPPKLKLMEGNTEKIIKEVLNVVGEKARTAGITFSTEIEPGLKCKCDADQIKQALLNIVLNALEACNKNGVVTIKAEKKKGAILMHVMDTGDGISKDIVSKIFDPYFTTKETGNGLGLSEVHRIITAHGGKITAENTENGGAVFSIYVPDNGDRK